MKKGKKFRDLIKPQNNKRRKRSDMQKAERHNDNANDHKWLNNCQQSACLTKDFNFPLADFV